MSVAVDSSSCRDVHTIVLPVLGHERGFSASVIGTILGTFAVAATLVRVAMPMIATRLQEWAVMTVAMASTAVLLGIYPLLHSPLAMGRRVATEIAKEIAAYQKR